MLCTDSFIWINRAGQRLHRSHSYQAFHPPPMASKTLEAPFPPLPIASNKLVVPFLPLPEGLFPNQTLPAEEDAELPRLIDIKTRPRDIVLILQRDKSCIADPFARINRACQQLHRNFYLFSIPFASYGVEEIRCHFPIPS